MASDSLDLSLPRTLSEHQRKHRKRERNKREEREAEIVYERMERRREEFEREDQVQRETARAQEVRDQALSFVGRLILLVVIVGVCAALVVWVWRKMKQEKQGAGAVVGAGGMIQKSSVVKSGEINPFGVYGPPKAPQIPAFSSLHYQAQPVFLTRPGSPVDSIDPAGFSSVPSYSDAPPAYISRDI